MVGHHFHEDPVPHSRVANEGFNAFDFHNVSETGDRIKRKSTRRLFILSTIPIGNSPCKTDKAILKSTLDSKAIPVHRALVPASVVANLRRKPEDRFSKSTPVTPPEGRCHDEKPFHLASDPLSDPARYVL